MCACVRDGCGRGCNEFVGRVQNHHVRFSFHRNGHNNIIAKAAGLDTLRCSLRERCHCGRLPSHYRRARTQDYLACWSSGPERYTIFHLPVTACREQSSHCLDERLAGVASRWQGTSCSSSFVSKVLGANCKRANNFNLVADKFARQELTFEPISMRMHVWITIHYHDRQVLLHNYKTFYLDMGTTVPIAITVMSTHIFVICKFVIMYNM